jgi:hypothetical protein
MGRRFTFLITTILNIMTNKQQENTCTECNGRGYLIRIPDEDKIPCPSCTQENMEERLTPEKLASLFHDTYEALAPVFGYETREDTRNFDLESKNGKLMVAVCKFIIQTEMKKELALNTKQTEDRIVREIEDYVLMKTEGSNASLLERGSIGSFAEHHHAIIQSYRYIINLIKQNHE